MTASGPLLLLVGLIARGTPIPHQAPSPSGAVGAMAPSPTSRTVPYHSRDLVALRAKVRYTTLIVLPQGEDIIEVTCGDKEFWIVNVRGPLAYVKPAKVGSATNLNLVTASGQVYAFVLTEISDVKGGEPDLSVYIEPDDPAGFRPWHEPPKYVPAQQVDDLRAQVALAKQDTIEATRAAQVHLEEGLTTFRSTYPLSLKFAYRFAPNVRPFLVRAMFHDDRATYIQTEAAELPSLYELKDGTPNLVNFQVRGGTYIVPKVLDRGYLAIGKKRFIFTRVEPR